MTRICALIACLIFASAAQAFGPAQQLSQGLTKLGFTCTPAPQGDGGASCVGRSQGYPLPVHVFIPGSVTFDSGIELLIHLHGFTFGKPVATEVFGRYDFQQMLFDAHVTGVLVVPESADQCATYVAAFDTQTAATAMFTGLRAALNAAAGLASQKPFRKIELTGHSGAYKPLALAANIVTATDFENQYGPVRALGLFEAAYGMAPELATLASRIAATSGRVFSAYLNEGTLDSGTTAYWNLAIENELKKLDVNFETGSLEAGEKPILSGESPFIRFFAVAPDASRAGVQHWDVPKLLPSFWSWVE